MPVPGPMAVLLSGTKNYGCNSYIILKVTSFNIDSTSYTHKVPIEKKFIQIEELSKVLIDISFLKNEPFLWKTKSSEKSIRILHIVNFMSSLDIT